MPITEVIIRPNGIGTFNGFPTLFGAATKNAAVSDSSDSSGTGPDDAAQVQTFTYEDIPSPGGSLVASVEVFSRVSQNDGGFLHFTPRLYLNGIALDGTLVAHAVQSIITTSQVFTSKPGTGAFTIFDINALEIGGFFNWSSAPPDIRDQWAKVKYHAIPLKLESVRRVITMGLLSKRSARTLHKIEGPLTLADPDHGDLVPWSHPRAVSESGAGWGERRWERRPTRILKGSINPNNMHVTIVAEDARRGLYLLYDEGRTLVNPSSYANGVARFYVGLRTFERDSKAWVADPSDGYVRELGYDIEALSGGTFAGQLIEGASTNQITRSSAVSGNTGITLTGNGVNGSALDLDAADVLFVTAISPSSWRYVAGSPHAGDMFRTWPAIASLAANSPFRIAIDRKDEVGAVLYVRVTRGVDGQSLNFVDGTWGAGVVSNPLPVSIAKDQYVSPLFNVGANATTLTVAIGQLAGGTAARKNWVYHIQLEAKRFISSRIVSDGTAASRAAALLKYSNDAGDRNWLASMGTFGCEVIPEWNASDLNGGTVLIAAANGTLNGFRLEYDSATLQLLFRVTVNGATVTATKAWSPVRGTVYRLAARWTSAEGELDLQPYTASVFVDGVKGTDAVAGGSPVEASTAEIFIGGDGSAEPFGGVLRRIFVSQRVHTDIEIARGLPLR